MRAPIVRSLLIGCLAIAPALAPAAQGLSVPVPSWQGRLALGVPTLDRTSEPAPASGFSLMGDYYFLDRGTSGLRATSGVVSGARSTLWAGMTGLQTQRGGLAARRQALATESSDATLPYVGVGYTGLSVRQRWSLSADVGLLAMGPAVKLGRSGAGAQNYDEFVRELRLSPVVQLGVSYSF